MESYSLPCPQEGTEGLADALARGSRPALRPHHENRLVIGLSGRDIEFGLSTARSRLNLANILDSASQNKIEVFVVGPPPTLDPAQNRRLGELNTAFADVTTRRKHLYVDTFSPLLNHEQWRQDLAANGGTPGQAGYGLMAWLVLHRGWFQWLRIWTLRSRPLRPFRMPPAGAIQSRYILTASAVRYTVTSIVAIYRKLTLTHRTAAPEEPWKRTRGP